jgi:hypothetical protein
MGDVGSVGCAPMASSLKLRLLARGYHVITLADPHGCKRRSHWIASLFGRMKLNTNMQK